MAKIVKTLTVSWQWSGDKYSLRGFNLAVTPAAKNPKEEVVATAFVETKEIKQTYSYKMGNVTLDKDAQYKIWVQAVYENSDSDWVATGGATVSDDGSATIITKTDREIQDIVNMASDNILTRQEKISLRREWQEIVYEFLEIESTAISQGIPSSNTAFSNFKSKGNALGTYLNGGTTWTISSNNKTSFPLWINDSNLGSNTSINGNTYRETFRVYYEAKVKILEEINKYKVNSIQVGGRNLLRNSQNYSNWLGENGTTVSTIDNSNEPTKILQVTTNGGASGHVKINVSNYIRGEEYILSFYAKNISGDKTIKFEPHGGPVYSVTSTSEWVQYKVKVIPNQNWSSTAPYFYFNNKNNTSVFQIKNVKLEKGNKATDWSPAPEDTTADINTAKNEAINSANSTLTTTIANYYTKAQTDSQINVAKEAINLGVSNTYETKSNVETKVNNAVNNIQIGGRNLLPKNSLRLTNSATGTFDSTTNTWSLVAPKGSNSWGRGLVITTPNSIVIPYGQGVTYSFEIKVPKQVSWNFDVNNAPVSGSNWNNNDHDEISKRTSSPKTITKVNEWVKCWAYAENTSTTNTNKVDLKDSGSTIGLITTNETSDVAFYIRNVKVELGNKATDWSPCPTDIDASINSKANSAEVYKKTEVYTKNETNSQINVAKSDITLAVSNTYETKSNVETKVNNAINSIQVGGRNLFLKSDIDKYGMGFWISNGGTGSVEGTYIDGTRAIKVVGNSGIVYNSWIKLKRNTTYVYSMMMKASPNTLNILGNRPLHMWLNTTESSNHLEIIQSTSGTVPANTWTKAYVVFKTPNTQDVYYMKPFVYDIGNNTVYISKVKIEEGTKATDWTPAPEDVQGLIDSKANSADVYNKSETYTKSETESKINVAKNDITLSVSNTYETKTNVENKVNNAVNNIQIGGRNLFKDTKDYGHTSTSVWNNSYGSLANSSEVYNGCKVVRVTSQWGRRSQSIACEKNAEYVISAWVKGGNTTTSIGTYCEGASIVKTAWATNVAVGTAWKRYWGVVRSGSAQTSLPIRIEPNNSSNCDLYICGLMVEKGTKPSDWTPAPEDVDSAINSKANSSDVYKKSETYTKSETDSKISVAKNDITLAVSNTYETKTNVENKVNNAVTGLEVGGNNLLRNGNFAYDMANWSIHDMSSGGTSKSVAVENGGSDWKPANKKVLVIRGTNTTDRYGVISSTMKLIPKTKYTISGYCAGHRVNKIQVNVRDVQGSHANIHTININPVSGGSTLDKWYRFETTFTTSSNSDFALNLYSVNFADNGYVWFCDVQIQQGTKATAWTPCSEDINSSINSKANSSDVYKKTEVYTKSETNSQINVAKDSITSSVSQNYVTKGDATNTYATKSSLTQTTNSITAKFETSGGSNLVKNGAFKNGTAYWTKWGSPSTYQVQNSSNGYGQELRIVTTDKDQGASQTIEGLRTGRPHTVVADVWVSSGSCIIYIVDGGTWRLSSVSSGTGWKKLHITFTPSNTSVTLRIGRGTEGSNGDYRFTGIRMYEGEAIQAWTPHHSEVYGGITTIDKDGITVTSSNVKSKTSMSANGFKITKTDTNEDVFKVNSDGTLTLKGNMTITGGSVSDNALSSTIRNGASAGSSAKSTLDSKASGWDSAKSTVDSNSSNWGNAYNRVKEWASGAVTGSTNINGGMIATDTITAKQMAIGDFNNYSQLAKGKNLVNRYGTANWVEGTNSHSFWKTTNEYFPFTVNETLNPFKAGDKIQIKFDAYTPSTRNVNVGVWFYSDTSASSYIGSVTGAVSCSASWGTKTVNLTLPTGNTYIQNAKSIAILIQNGSSGERIEVRNATVNRLVAGDLIVNGTITTDHIHTNGLNASVIKAGTIDASKISVTNLNASNITSGTLKGRTIEGGTIRNNTTVIDSAGLTVSHTEANTRTQMNSKGFFIYNSQGETVGSLATETGLSIVNANKVYANNIPQIYEGDSNLYVNHNHTGSNQGTSQNPFRSFADLKRHLESQPIINKNLSIYIKSTGGDITEQLFLTGLTGSGWIWIYYDKACVHRQPAAGQYSIVLDNITNYIGIEGNRSNYNSNDGAIICDGWNAHGISIANCSNVFVGNINIHCQNWGIKVARSRIRTRRIDFCGTWCCLDLSQLSHGTDSDSCGGSSGGDFFRLYDGSIFLYGDSGGGYRPVGGKVETSGRYLLVGNERTATASFRTPPPKPTTSDQYGTWSMRDYGYFTYGRNGINVNSWNPSSKRIQQGEWSGYGNNYGFAFFDDAGIRSWLSNGTPKDGSTITLKRASSGGYSSSQPVYLCGATNTSCSGTPSGVKSYGNIGSLAWGETKTFNLPTSFVNDLKSGAIKSVCFYDSSGASYVKIDSVSIKLKANKPV